MIAINGGHHPHIWSVLNIISGTMDHAPSAQYDVPYAGDIIAAEYSAAHLEFRQILILAGVTPGHEGEFDRLVATSIGRLVAAWASMP